MTLTQWLFEGASDGTTATAANTGATTVSAGGGTIKFAASAAAAGACGLQFVTTAAGQNAIARFPFAEASNQFAFSLVFRAPSSLAVATQHIRVRSSTDSNYPLTIQINTAGVFRVNDSAGAQIGANYTLTAGALYRLELVVTGGSTTAGVATGHLYDASGAAVATYSTSTANLLTSTPNQIEIGNTNAAGAASLDFDNLQVSTGATSEIGPVVVALATPVVSVSATAPSTVGGSDGTITLTWAAVPGAVSYETALVAGTVSSGFVADSTGITGTSKTYTGLTAGARTVAVRAKAA